MKVIHAKSMQWKSWVPGFNSDWLSYMTRSYRKALNCLVKTSDSFQRKFSGHGLSTSSNQVLPGCKHSINIPEYVVNIESCFAHSSSYLF